MEISVLARSQNRIDKGILEMLYSLLSAKSLLSYSLSVCIGFLSKLERKPYIDFNGDNIIGHEPDIYYDGYEYSRMPLSP